ncbi:MAG: uroporphyrinogen decarboxylase family protein [Puniceicoccaceae bacterium]
MTSRERVAAALNHELPDRCPMFSSYTPEFAARLTGHLSGKTGEGHNPHGGGNTYDLERALGIDILATSIGWANNYYAGDRYNPGADHYTDDWGVGWKNTAYKTQFGDGIYTEIEGHPLEDDDAISSYKAPDPEREELYTDAASTLKNFQKDYFIVGSTMTTIFETAWALRGLENMLMDFVEDPDLASEILDIPLEYHRAVTKRLVSMGVDMVWLGDDIGAQHSMFISPDTWRQFLKPRMAGLISDLKGINPNLKIVYHTDGCVYPVIPELIEIGVDILNPIQPASMDPARLKKEYGDRLCFWGSVDEQHTLPFGSVDDVKNEVVERIQTLGASGGLIISPTHHVQLDTPIENYEAFISTVKNTPCQP